MALNINNNYQTGEVPNNTNNGQQKEVENEVQKADQQLREYYNSLGNYSAPSMSNICDLHNAGYIKESDYFDGKHSNLCNIYGKAASAFGDVLGNLANQTVSDVKNAIANVKNATDKAVAGLKALIHDEDTVIEAKIEVKNAQNAENEQQENAVQENTVQQNVSSEKDTQKTIKEILSAMNIEYDAIPEDVQKDLIKKYANIENFASINNLEYYDEDTLKERLVWYAQAKLGYSTNAMSSYIRQRNAESIRKQFNSNKPIGSNETIVEYYQRLEKEAKRA